MLISISFAFTYPRDGKIQIKVKDSRHITVCVDTCY